MPWRRKPNLLKRANKIGSPTTLDLGYLKAATILASLPEDGFITIYLVGCGGTGSFMAMHIGRLLFSLAEAGKRARAVFVDHDHVEAKNLGRQLFCRAEINQNKAAALAFRYGSAWGLEISAIAEKFKGSMVKPEFDSLTIIVGCVDNAAARKEISRALKHNRPNVPPRIWWLDCGNHENAGQVLLGSAPKGYWSAAKAFRTKTICQSLPAPVVLRPELLKPLPEEKNPQRLSCAELAAANLQSLNINARIAAEASEFLTGLLLTRDLKRFACELNLPAGSMRSSYATPEAVEKAIA